MAETMKWFPQKKNERKIMTLFNTKIKRKVNYKDSI